MRRACLPSRPTSALPGVNKQLKKGQPTTVAYLEGAVKNGPTVPELLQQCQ